MIENSEQFAIAQKLIDAGFIDGWALQGTELVLWEHDENPPAPLTKPTK